MLGWLCFCFDLDIECFDDESAAMDRFHPKSKSRNKKGYINPNHNGRTKTSNSTIIEDSLLEDMCELANEEFDGEMNEKGKAKMLNKLSKNQKTEQYFRTKNDLDEFMENK